MFNLGQLNPLLKLWKRIDLVLFFVIVPVVLTLIFLFHSQLKNYVVLQIKSPNLLTMFLSNYSHQYLDHFFFNIVIYFIVIFLIFNLETDRKFFYKSILVIFLLLPFISSSTTLLEAVYLKPNLQISEGFSAIVSGIIAYLIYSLYFYLKKFYSKSLKMSFAGLLFAINGLVYVSSINSMSSIILFILLIALIYHNKNPLKYLYNGLEIKTKELSKMGFFERMYKLFIALFVIFFTTLSLTSLLTYGVNLQTGAETDVLAHYAGYLVGFFAPLIIKKYGSVETL